MSSHENNDTGDLVPFSTSPPLLFYNPNPFPLSLSFSIFFSKVENRSQVMIRSKKVKSTNILGVER